MSGIVLGSLIEKLRAEGEDAFVAPALGSPHSYRGYYSELCLEIVGSSMPAAQLAEMLEQCLDATFEGYKGGDFTMNQYTDVWIGEYGTSYGDLIGPTLYEFLLGRNPADLW